MSDINIGNFSDTLSRKADCDLRNIDTTKCDMVIEYQEPDPENEYKWYRLYASGWVEQGGTITTDNDAAFIQTLPIQMANTNYYVFISRNTTSDYPEADMNGRWNPVYNLTTTTFTTWGKWGNKTGIVYWKACGLADMTHHEILPNPTSNTARALVIQVLESMYPVGSVYLGTQSVCPMSAFFGTWELVSSDKALWTGDGTNANTTIEAGLPDHNHAINNYGHANDGPSSVFFVENGNNAVTVTTTNASASNPIYGNSNTVQPPAYVVNVWRRTA